MSAPQHRVAVLAAVLLASACSETDGRLPADGFFPADPDCNLCP